MSIEAKDLNYVCRSVALARLMPTQDELIPSVIDHYRQRTRMTDEDGALPYGICFKGSSTVYITNGHHRWYVCRERGRKSMRMWVLQHQLTLRDAVFACHLPPPPAPKKSKRRAAPPATQLAFQFA